MMEERRRFEPYAVPADLHTPGPRRDAVDAAMLREADRAREEAAAERDRVWAAYVLAQESA